MPKEREEQLETSGVNIRTVFAAFVITYGTSFQFGYNVGVLNQPSNLIKSFYNETYMARRNGVPLDPMSIILLWTFTTAVMFVPGGLVGAFLGGWLADTLGRKRGILMSQAFIALGAILCVICVPVKSPELMMLGRVFIGINIGIGNCIAPMFLQEIVQQNLRGAFGTLHQLAITLGILMGSVFGLPQILGAGNRWQYLMLLEFAPIVVTCVFLPIIYESPRFLLLVRRDADGSRLSLEYYRKSKEVDAELKEMEAEGRAMESLHQRTIIQMFSADIRKALLICCILQIIQQFSGINAVMFYSSAIFDNAGVSLMDIPYVVVGTNALNVIMTIVTVPLMDIAGRRKLLLIPIFAMVIVLSGLTVCLHFQRDHPFTAYISIVCVLLYVVAFAFGLGPIPLMIGSELFRQDARSKAMAGGGIVNLLATFIIGQGFEPAQKGLGNNTFIVFIGCLCCSFIFIYFLVPETKHRTFDEIAAELSGDKKVAPTAKAPNTA